MNCAAVVLVLSQRLREERKTHGVMGIGDGKALGFQNNRRADGTKASQKIIGATAIIPSSGFL